MPTTNLLPGIAHMYKITWYVMVFLQNIYTENKILLQRDGGQSEAALF